MKKLQIMIEEDLDSQLELTARASGRSKAAVIRELVRERLRPLPPLASDPIARMIGRDDYEPVGVDEAVYR